MPLIAAISSSPARIGANPNALRTPSSQLCSQPRGGGAGGLAGQRIIASAISTAPNDSAFRPKQSASPTAAISTPARAGPTTRAQLISSELSAMAFGSSLLCSTSRAIIACRSGMSNADAQPSTSASAATCQTATTPVAASTARVAACASITDCVISSARRRSTRSASTPATGAMNSTAMYWQKVTKPRSSAEPDSR